MKKKKCCRCHKYRAVDQFSWKVRARNIRAAECKICHRKWRDIYYINNKDAEHRRVKNRAKQIRQWLDDYKSILKCEDCGENHPATLHFHHMDPKKKELDISRIPGYGWGIKKIMKEIKKCKIWCANCHAKHNWGHRYNIK